MRRGALALARSLWLTQPGAGAPAAAAALLQQSGLPAGLVSCGAARHWTAGQAAHLPPPAAACHHYGTTAAASDNAAAAAAPAGEEQRAWRRMDPASPLGRLAACRGVAEMRAWRQGLQASGAFGAFELGAAIRTVVRARRVGAAQREAYMRELLALAGSVPLDSRAAAYVLWGPAKLGGWAANDADVQAALPLAMQHADAMEGRDAAALLWALGSLRLRPTDDDQLQALLRRLGGQLEDLRVSQLTAAATGALQLDPVPTELLAELMRAFDAKVPAEQQPMEALQVGSLLQVLPKLPGATAGGSPAVAALYEAAASQASKLPLETLAAAVFEAKKLQHDFSADQLKALLEAASKRLHENRGPEVQSLLHGLVLLGHTADQAPEIEQFVRAAAVQQAQAVRRGRKRGRNTGRLLCTLGSLRAKGVPEDVCRRLLRVLQEDEAGLQGLEQPWRIQMAFRRLGFAEGVEALEPYTQHTRQQQPARRQRRRQRQQPQQEQPAEGDGQEPEGDGRQEQ